MNPSKILDFKANHPAEDFPSFRTLEPSGIQVIRSRLGRLTGLPEDAAGLSIVKAIEKTGQVLITDDLRNFPGDIVTAFDRHQVTPSSRVYVNWYRFDEIDELRTQDFLRWFPDLWYTAAEDPDIFDEGLEWMLSLRHYRAFVLRSFEEILKGQQRE